MSRIQLDEEVYQIVKRIGIVEARRRLWETFKKKKFADLDCAQLQQFIKENQE